MVQSSSTSDQIYLGYMYLNVSLKINSLKAPLGLNNFFQNLGSEILYLCNVRHKDLQIVVNYIQRVECELNTVAIFACVCSNITFMEQYAQYLLRFACVCVRLCACDIDANINTCWSW